MGRSGFEDVAQFIHYIEDDLVHIRMQRTIALAIQAVGIGPLRIVLRQDGGRFIELRIVPQQRMGLFRPGLVPEQIDLRHQADTPFPANRYDPPDVVLGQVAGVP